MDHASSRTVNQHVEALAKAELAHDVVRQVAEPVRQVDGQSLPVMARFDILAISLAGKDGAELADMQQHQILHALQRIVRERLAEHAPFPAMHGLIDDIVGVVHALDGREGVVEVGLFQPLPVAVDVVQALDRVDGDEIRRHAHVRAVLLVESVQPQVPVALEAVVELHPGRHRRE